MEKTDKGKKGKRKSSPPNISISIEWQLVKFMNEQLCFYISVCIHISGYTCTYMFVGLEICICVPLALQLSVYLCSFVVPYYLGQKLCLIQLYISSGECSISQILMFVGLNECGCDNEYPYGWIRTMWVIYILV